MILSKTSFLTCCMVLTLAPMVLFAGDCLETSPTRLGGKDIYDPVKPQDLTPSEHAHLLKMLLSMDGDWIGEGTEVRCMSTSDPAEKDVNLYRLRGEVDTDSRGNMLLEIDLRDETQHTSHQQVFRLYLNAKRLRYENDGGAGDVELQTLKPFEIKFIYRVSIRGRSTSGSPLRKEFYISLIKEQNAFTIHRDIYTRGRLTAKWRWRFQRDG